MLGKLCRCGSCGYRLSHNQRTVAGVAYRYARCKANPACQAVVNIAAQGLEEWVVGAALEWMGTVYMERGGQDDVALAEARAALASAEADLAEVGSLRGKMKPAACGMAYEDAEAARDRALVALEGTGTGAPLLRSYILAPSEAEGLGVGSTADAFARLSVPQQRQILREVVERVVVAPGKGTVAERCRIEWRGDPGARVTEEDAPERSAVDGTTPFSSVMRAGGYEV